MNISHVQSHPLDELIPSNTWPETIFWGSLWVLCLPVTILLKSIQWIIDQCDDDQIKIRTFKKELWNYVNSKEPKTIQELNEIIRKPDIPPQYLKTLYDLLSVREFLPHIREILAGANVQINNHQAIQRIFENSYLRRSSHNYAPGTSRAIEDRIVHQILIWQEQDDGSFRMQLENSAFGVSIIPSILHWIDDWLKHLATGKQIGPYGLSAHTDDRPLVITIISS